MNTVPIVGLYASTVRDRTRFIVRRRFSPSRESFDVYRACTLRELVVRLLEVFADADPGFMAKVTEIEDKQFMAKRRKLRHYVADRREHLYIDSSHLTVEHSLPVRGYWIITNIGKKEVSAFLRLCSQAAGVPLENISKFQSDRLRTNN
jgi:hypothetical protein